MLEEYRKRVEALKATPLKPSNAMVFARLECNKARELRDAAAAEATRIAETFNPNGNMGTLSGVVQAAQTRLADAEERYRKARVSLAEARKAYAPRFLETIGPKSAETRALVAELASVLAEAVEPAILAEDFAVANSLPVNRITSRARRIRHMARALKDLAA